MTCVPQRGLQLGCADIHGSAGAVGGDPGEPVAMIEVILNDRLGKKIRVKCK